MREITLTVRGTNLIPSTRLIGRVGEEAATQCRVNVSEWAAKWPDAVFNVLVRDPNGAIHIAAASAPAVAGWVSFDITSDIIPTAGNAIIEVNAHTDGRITISGMTPNMIVEASLLSGEPGTSEPSWVQEVLKNVNEVAEDSVLAQLANTNAQEARVKAEIAQEAAETAAKNLCSTSDSIFAKSQDSRLIRPSFGWIDDDAKSFVYTDLYPWAQELNVPFTEAVPTAFIGTAGRCTAEQLTTMYQSGLVQFSNHTRSHISLTGLSENAVESEIVGAISDMEAIGLSFNSIAYPFGDIDDHVINVTRKHHRFGYGAGGAETDPYRVNTIPIYTHRLERLSVNTSSVLSNIQAQIDYACANNCMMVFMSHVGAAGEVTEAEMQLYTDVVNYIRSKGYDIEPVSVIQERFKNSVEVGNWSYLTPVDYFVVGANGLAKTDALISDNYRSMDIAPDDAYNNDTPPSEYPADKVTMCYVNTEEAAGLPPDNSRGMLTCYKIGSYAYRTFFPTSKNELYTQLRATSTDAWNAWEELNFNYYEHLSNNAVLPRTAPADLPDKVNICLISDSDALASLPVPTATQAYIVSYKISTTAMNAWEELHIRGDTTFYKRSAISSSAWGPWEPAYNDVSVNEDAAPVLGTVLNKRHYRCTNPSITTAPAMTIAAIKAAKNVFEFKVTFKAPNTTAPVITNNNEDIPIKYRGDDVSGGVFTPVAGTVYDLKFEYNGIYLNCEVTGNA